MNIVKQMTDKAYSTMLERAQKIYAYFQAEFAVSMEQQRMNIRNGKQKQIVSMQVDPRTLITINTTWNEGIPQITVSVNLQNLNRLSRDQMTLAADLFHRAQTRVFKYA